MFNRFIYKVFLFFVIPIVFIGLIELFLPINFFTFRNYEALKFSNERIPHIGPFYPNKFLKMNSVGDLCSHTEYAVNKNEIWKTDRLGFRNSMEIKNPDIVVFGSSFIYGTGTTQTRTFTEQLSQKLHLKVFNFAPNSINDFERLVKCDSLKYPKILLYAIGDWYVPSAYKKNETSEMYKYNLVKQLLYTGFNEKIDRFSRFYSYQFFKALFTKRDRNYQSKVEPRMFFGKGGYYKRLDDGELENIIYNVSTIKKYCDDRNIKFYYVFTPSKEIIYSELASVDKELEIYSYLKNQFDLIGINGFDTYELFYKHKRKTLIYHYDDTHWNDKGIHLITSKISEDIKKNLMYK